MLDPNARAFYVPGAASIIDFERTAGSGIATFSGETLAQVQARQPGAILGDLQAFVDQKEAGYLARPVTEIDLAAWTAALEVLPPACWGRSSGIESFQCCEMLDGRITSTYVRTGARYFEMLAIMGTPRSDLAARVRPLLEPPAEPFALTGSNRVADAPGQGQLL